MSCSLEIDFIVQTRLYSIMLRVLIADDHLLFASGLRALLDGEQDFEVVGVVHEGTRILHEVQKTKPDVLLLDLNLPGRNGLEVLEELPEYAIPKVYIVTMYNDDQMIEQVRRLGASGYFLKNSDEQEILEVLSGQVEEFYITRSQQKRPEIKSAVETTDSFEKIGQLTRREKEILKHIVQGKSSPEIGQLINISSTTVDTHRKNMMRKLDLNKISELISYAYKNGLA
jgi:DNA-binding NarL/FixJ family response regulator